MNSKISDFLSGFISPSILTIAFDPECFHPDFWVDQIVFIFISVVTGILVALFKDKIIRMWKK
jgi:hypothetical protein